MNRICEGKIRLVNEEKGYIVIDGDDGGLYVGNSSKDIEKEEKVRFEIQEQSRKAIKIKRLGNS